MKKIKEFILIYLINTDEKWINPHCFIKRWGIAIVATYGIWLLFAFFQQEHYLFFPSQTNAQTPSGENLKLSSVLFKTKDEKKLTGVFLEKENSEEVVLFFHENAGNLTNYLGVFSLFEKLGKNALIFDYRNFGLSEGTLKTEDDFLLDAEAAIKFLKEEKGFSEKNIILWGKGFGAFFATKMKQKNPQMKLIIENPMKNINTSMPWFLRYFVPRFLIKYKFNLAKEIVKIKTDPIVLWKTDNKINPTLKTKIPNKSHFLEISSNTNDIGVFIAELQKLIPNKSTKIVPKLN